MNREDIGLMTTLALLAFMGPFTLTVFLPALPSIAAGFGSPVGLVQLSVSLAMLAVVGANLVAGPAVDRFGRRPVVILSQALCLVGAATSLYAPTIGWLIAGRTLLAAAASTGLVISRAAIGDRFSGPAAVAAVSVATAGCVLALLLGPPLGGWLVAASGWPAVFVLQAALACLALVATLRWLPERVPSATGSGAAQAFGAAFVRVWRTPTVAAWLLHGSLHYGALMAFIGGLPHILAGDGEPPTTFGLGMLVPVTTLTLGMVLATRWRERVAPHRIVLAGSALALAAPLVLVPILASLMPPSHPALYFAPVSIGVIGAGLAFPFTQAAIIGAVGDGDRGTAGSLMGALPMLAGAVAAQAVVAVPLDRMPLVLVALTLGAAALALVAAIRVSPSVAPAH